MYLKDLTNATEVVLDKNTACALGESHHPKLLMTIGGGSSGRVAAGASGTSWAPRS